MFVWPGVEAERGPVADGADLVGRLRRGDEAAFEEFLDADEGRSIDSEGAGPSADRPVCELEAMGRLGPDLSADEVARSGVPGRGYVLLTERSTTE
jgi:hypothetical protein